jgi:hypothetical protein
MCGVIWIMPHMRVPPAKLQNALDKAAGSLPRSNICTFS